MKYRRPLHEMQWAIDAAIEVSRVDRQSLMSRRRWRPIPEVWRGIYWFLSRQGWSSLAIGGALGHDPGGIRHAIRKGEPAPGAVSHRVSTTLAEVWAIRATSANARIEQLHTDALELHARELAAQREEELRRLREEEESLGAERVQRQAAIAGSLVRIQPPDPNGIVVIEMKHRGRPMPTRRVCKAEAGPLDVGCFRVEAVPPFLGGAILVPVPEGVWRDE